MGVLEQLELDLEEFGDAAARSTLAETAKVLARDLDAPSSATSHSLCAKSMIDVLRELRSLAPPKPEEDEVERARKRRADRREGIAASGSPASS